MIEIIIMASGLIIAILIAVIIFLSSVIKRDFNRIYKLLDTDFPRILTELKLHEQRLSAIEEIIKNKL